MPSPETTRPFPILNPGRAKAEPKEQIAWPVLDADGRILAATTLASLSFFDFASGEELASVAPSRPTGIGPLRFHRTHGWVIWMATPGVTVDTAFWPCRPDPHQPNLLRIGPPRGLGNKPYLLSSSNAGAADLSADGRILVVPNGNKGALMLHLDEAGKEIRLGPQYDVRHVAVSPNGRWVVTCSWWEHPRYKSVRIWDAASGAHVHDLPLTMKPR